MRGESEGIIHRPSTVEIFAERARHDFGRLGESFPYHVYTGDGIMALFGSPIAHEDHAACACYAALSLQEDLRR